MFDRTSEYFESLGLVISQPARGYRYGAPAIALAEFSRARAGWRVAELGGGCGVVATIIASRDRPASVVAVEIQRGLHDVAVCNALENGLGEILRCVNDDYRRFAPSHRRSFDLVVANPPFYAPGCGRLPMDSQRAAAHHELNGTLGELVSSASLMLVPGGRFSVVLPDERRFELTTAAAEEGLVPRRVLRGGSSLSADALFLVEFVRQG